MSCCPKAGVTKETVCNTKKVGVYELRYEKVLIESGLVLEAGTVLGKRDGDGLVVAFDTALADGEGNIPKFILPCDIDATDAPKDGLEVEVIASGWVNSNEIIFVGSDTVDTLIASENSTVKDTLRKYDIILKEVGVL